VPMTCLRFRRFARLLFLPLWLTACASSNNDNGKPSLPAEPTGLAACTDATVPALPGAVGTGWGNDETPGIIGDQRTAALAKNKCSHDWRSFYSDLRNKMAN
jgi:hypothetical protein